QDAPLVLVQGRRCCASMCAEAPFSEHALRIGHSALTRVHPVPAAPGLSHRRPANCAVFLAFPSGIPYAAGLRHLIPRRDAMQKKENGKSSGTRVVKDL